VVRRDQPRAVRQEGVELQPRRSSSGGSVDPGLRPSRSPELSPPTEINVSGGAAGQGYARERRRFLACKQTNLRSSHEVDTAVPRRSHDTDKGAPWQWQWPIALK